MITLNDMNRALGVPGGDGGAVPQFKLCSSSPITDPAGGSPSPRNKFAAQEIRARLWLEAVAGAECGWGRRQEGNAARGQYPAGCSDGPEEPALER